MSRPTDAVFCPLCIPQQHVTQVTHQATIPSGKEESTRLTQQRGCASSLHTPHSSLCIPSALLREHLAYRGPEAPPEYQGISQSLEQPGDLAPGGHPSPSPRRHIHCPHPQEDPGYKCPSLATASSLGSSDERDKWQPTSPASLLPIPPSSCPWGVRNLPEMLGCSWHKNAGE